ncbi:MAG: PqqD family protein, partial [Myxococcota bacterium]
MSPAQPANPPERVYERNPDTVTRTIAGETFILAIRGKLANLERMYVLDEVSQAIWDGLDGTRPVSAIVSHITDQFDVEYDTALHDTATFLKELEG